MEGWATPDSQCSGLTPGSVLTEHFWKGLGGLSEVPEMEPGWAVCQASALPTMLWLQPLDSLYYLLLLLLTNILQCS